MSLIKVGAKLCRKVDLESQIWVSLQYMNVNVTVPSSLYLPWIEVLSSITAQHHLRGAKSTERYRGSDSRIYGRWTMPVRPQWRLDHSPWRGQKTGRAARQTGGECTDSFWDERFSRHWAFMRCFSIYSDSFHCVPGVCGSRYSVRAWGWTGGSGGVCALHQWIHHWQRARLSGGPGGLCSSPGAAVWAPGAVGLDAVLALSFSESHSSEDAITLELMSNITNVFVYFSYLNCFRYFK